MVPGEERDVVTGVRPRILLAVTSDVSLILMRGFPEYLVERGWDVHIVSAPGEQLRRLTAFPGLETHPLAMTREPSPFRDLMALIRWIRLLRALEPDIVSAGTPKAGLLGMLAGRLVGVPHRVYHLRGLRMETFRGARRHVLAATERLAASSASRVLSVSKSLMSEAVDLGLVDPTKILVLGAGSSNGVDVANFDRRRFSERSVRRLREGLGLVEGVPVIGFVGRLTADKGLATLIGARRFLVERGVDHQLLIVGDDNLSSTGAGLVEAPEGGRASVLTGHVADAAIYYQLMDVLCLPTHREGFPNVVLEAAASRVPAVTTTATGARDSVQDGRTGYLVSVGSAAELGSRLRALLEDEPLRRNMGDEAYRVVVEDFGRERSWERSEAFYHGLIASGANRRRETT